MTEEEKAGRGESEEMWGGDKQEKTRGKKTGPGGRQAGGGLDGAAAAKAGGQIFRAGSLPLLQMDRSHSSLTLQTEGGQEVARCLSSVNGAGTDCPLQAPGAPLPRLRGRRSSPGTHAFRSAHLHTQRFPGPRTAALPASLPVTGMGSLPSATRV